MLFRVPFLTAKWDLRGRESSETAFFVAGMLLSSPARLAINSYVLETSASTHILNNIAVPYFDHAERARRSVAKWSRDAHLAAADGEESAIEKCQDAIDSFASAIWKINDRQLEAIRSALSEIEPSALSDSSDDEDE